MEKLIAVEFIEAHTPYAKGEIAGFEQKVAKELIDRKVAKELQNIDEVAKKKK